MAGESTHRYAGMGRDQVLRMTAGMRQNFANVGLPYAFTDQGLVANTMDAHRVLAWCASVRYYGAFSHAIDATSARWCAVQSLTSRRLAQVRHPRSAGQSC